MLTGTAVPKVKGLTSEQSEGMIRLSRLAAFKDLVDKVEADEVRRGGGGGGVYDGKDPVCMDGGK